MCEEETLHTTAIITHDGAFHLARKLGFGAGCDVTFELTVFHLQVGNRRWMHLLLLLLLALLARACILQHIT